MSSPEMARNYAEATPYSLNEKKGVKVMIEIQIEKGYARNLDELLDILYNFDNEDFNGNNGSDYLWECAKGYESNQAYTLDILRMQYGKKDWDYYTTAIEVCDSYFAHLFGKSAIYNFDFDVEDSFATITLAWYDKE